jgi:hypothetical protein
MAKSTRPSLFRRPDCGELDFASAGGERYIECCRELNLEIDRQDSAEQFPESLNPGGTGDDAPQICRLARVYEASPPEGRFGGTVVASVIGVETGFLAKKPTMGQAIFCDIGYLKFSSQRPPVDSFRNRITAAGRFFFRQASIPIIPYRIRTCVIFKGQPLRCPTNLSI